MKTEDDYVTELASVAREVAEARLKLREARKLVTEAETTFINAKLREERLQEEFRVFKNQTVRIIK